MATMSILTPFGPCPVCNAETGQPCISLTTDKPWKVFVHKQRKAARPPDFVYDERTNSLVPLAEVIATQGQED